jgi:hypothetical protein
MIIRPMSTSPLVFAIAPILFVVVGCSGGGQLGLVTTTVATGSRPEQFHHSQRRPHYDGRHRSWTVRSERRD